MAEGTLLAGSGICDISPIDAQYLFGYPHVPRLSTGVHDPLLSSALYLHDGRTALLFVTNDIIFVPKAGAARVRRRIAAATGVPAANILLSATHTHSGPSTVDYASLAADPTAPRVDPAYLRLFEDGMVTAATAAQRAARPAELGLALADARGVGSNRRDPAGLTDPEVPVLMVREAAGGAPIACMLVYGMHPTVLHEDSTLVSGDFPAMARQALQRDVLGAGCPVLYHSGPCGDQSPRHVTHANTFAEAERLGGMLAQRIAPAIAAVDYRSDVELAARRTLVDLPRRPLPSLPEAEAALQRAQDRLDTLRRSGAARQQVRTAEVDCFGAEETVTLARAAGQGRLEAVYAETLPAEIQLCRVGPWSFLGWPGEVFVAYGLAAKALRPQTYVIAFANGELQGYIATDEAVSAGAYEATCALFSPAAGDALVSASASLLAEPTVV